MRKAAATAFLLILLLSLPVTVRAGVNGEILQRSLDGDGNGYTVMRVWGSWREMGYAQGWLLAGEIESISSQLQTCLGFYYSVVKAAIGSTRFLPENVGDEIDGIVEALHEFDPASSIDAGDIKVIGTVGDWGYAFGFYCRSHSCWGSFVEPPVRTLSSRRLDWIDLPLESIDHVLCARIPSDRSSPRWVGLAFPGYVTVLTGVNEFGTVASLHDYETGGTPPSGSNVITRSAAARFALTSELEMEPSRQLDYAFDQLQPYLPYVGSFINYYVPEGYGGVFTCDPTQGFYKKRVPQPDYFGGEVLITTNSETDGHSTPSGGEFLAEYYGGARPKRQEDHWDILVDHEGLNGFQQFSVAFRGRNDMTVWFDGRLRHGSWTPRVEVEWSDLYRGFEPPGPIERTDYNGDGTSDVAVFRPDQGLWAIRDLSRFSFGRSGDLPVAADYDGDGTAEAAVFRGSDGRWAARGVTGFYFGRAGDQPLAADFRGDGTAAAALFRPSGGLWAVRGVTRFSFGAAGDVVAPGDYDGDGTKDVALFRSASSLWAVRGVTRFFFGTGRDGPVSGDYGGNGTWEAGIFRKETGLWSIRNLGRFYLGGVLDRPVPADVDGDGTDDAIVFRETEGWWSARLFTRFYFGNSGDLPATR